MDSTFAFNVVINFYFLYRRIEVLFTKCIYHNATQCYYESERLTHYEIPKNIRDMRYHLCADSFLFILIHIYHVPIDILKYIWGKNSHFIMKYMLQLLVPANEFC